MTPTTLTDDDLSLLREAAEAGFHATPPTVLALLDLVDEYRGRWRSLVERTLEGSVLVEDNQAWWISSVDPSAGLSLLREWAGEEGP